MLRAAGAVAAESAAETAARAALDVVSHPRLTLRGLRLEPELSARQHAETGLRRAAERTVARTAFGALSSCLPAPAAPSGRGGRVSALADVTLAGLGRSALAAVVSKATADLSRSFAATDACCCARQAVNLALREFPQSLASPEARACVREVWLSLGAPEVRESLGAAFGPEYAADLAGHAIRSVVARLAYDLTRNSSARSRDARRPGFVDNLVAGALAAAIDEVVGECVDAILVSPCKAWLRGEGWAGPAPRAPAKRKRTDVAPRARKLLAAGLRRALTEYFAALLANL